MYDDAGEYRVEVLCAQKYEVHVLCIVSAISVCKYLVDNLAAAVRAVWGFALSIHVLGCESVQKTVIIVTGGAGKSQSVVLKENARFRQNVVLSGCLEFRACTELGS